ncbi:MAG: FecR family protein [Prevotella sp.]|jgi:transmembrane sensor
MTDKSKKNSKEEYIEKALQIADGIANISDREMEEIASNPELLDACRDVFATKKVIIEQECRISEDEQYRKFLKRVNEKKSRIYGARFRWVAVAVAVIVCAILVTYQRNIPIQEMKQTELTYKRDEVKQPITMSGVKSRHYETYVTSSQKVLNVTQIADRITDTITVTIPKGETFTFILADGSKVYLHPDSKLIFPTKFTGKERMVELEGEAYFEIARDTVHPFKIRCQDVITTVLGTQFNVSAHNDKAVVTLVEGCLEVRAKKKGVRITPGEQVEMSNDGHTEITKVDTDVFTYWREGYFYFDNLTLEEVLITLGKHYNMSVSFQNAEMKDYRIHFIAERKLDIDKIIAQLNKITRVNVVNMGNTLVVE